MGLTGSQRRQVAFVFNLSAEQMCKFLLGKDCILELQAFKDTIPRSWLIGSLVQKGVKVLLYSSLTSEDGSMLVGTPFDPLLLILPALLQHKVRASML